MVSNYIQELLNKMDALTAILASQVATITKLTEAVAILYAENAELKERLNKNSKNSSKPPSSDGLNKPNPKSLRKSSGKKQGARPGHEDKGFSIIQAPNETIQHIPSKCIGCSNAGICVSCVISDTRYEMDIRINTKVAAHQVLSFVCPRENDTIVTGNFPNLITARMQYSDNIEALAVALNTVGMLGFNRTHNILSAVFGVPISTETIFNMVKSCAKKLAHMVE